MDNISQRYYDTTAQIVALQIQEKNLLAMMEKCETIEDMITVEQRLSEVQYQFDSLQTTRQYMDMDVAYSYVNISVSEVMEYHRDSDKEKHFCRQAKEHDSFDRQRVFSILSCRDVISVSVLYLRKIMKALEISITFCCGIAKDIVRLFQDSDADMKHRTNYMFKLIIST